MLLSNANTAPTPMPTRRNGSARSQTRGHKIRTANASGHDRTNKMHQRNSRTAAWGLTNQANRRRADGAQRRRRGVRVEREVRRRTRYFEHSNARRTRTKDQCRMR